MQKTNSVANYRRVVGGQLISSTTAATRSIDVEILRRRTNGSINWYFCQPRLALIWFRTGIKHLHLTSQGRSIDVNLSIGKDFCLFPADTEIEGMFEVGEYCDYAVIFIDTNYLAGTDALNFGRPFISFGDDRLRRGVADLCREAMHPDDLFSLFAEGWKMQTIAYLSRLCTVGKTHSFVHRGGLPAASLRRVEEYMRAELSEAITIDELSTIAGFSRRHFLRAFQQSTGNTPQRYLMSIRIETSKNLLSGSDRPITEIALNCGFSHAQHFATTFRKMTTMTPTEFRRTRRD